MIKTKKFYGNKDSFLSTEPSIKHKTILNHSSLVKSCLKSFPKKYKSKLVKQSNLSLFPTNPYSKGAFRIYSSGPNRFTRTKKKYLTLSPPSFLEREYYVEKNENAVRTKFEFEKKMLRGKLHYLLRNTCILDQTDINQITKKKRKNNIDDAKKQRERYIKNYRKMHNIGIITNRSNGLFNNISITSRHEDYHKTPTEFVRNNFTKKDMIQFENDPTFFNLHLNPFNKVDICFRDHLKEKLNEEEENSSKKPKQPKHKQKSNSVNISSMKSSTNTNTKQLTINTNNQFFTPRKKKIVLFHTEYINHNSAKLSLLNETITNKQSLHTDNKKRQDYIKARKLTQSNQNKIQKRIKLKQKEISDTKENYYISSLVDILKHNYFTDKHLNAKKA